jgi:hypothetical protein
MISNPITRIFSTFMCCMVVITLSTLLLLIQLVCCIKDLFGIREHMHNGGSLSSVRVPNLCPGEACLMSKLISNDH